MPLHFPHDLINEILLRLPVKSLSRFKCVSKSWLSSISSREFIKAHVKFNSSKDESNQGLLVLSVDNGNHYLIQYCSLNSLLYEQEEDPGGVNLDFPSDFPTTADLRWLSLFMDCCDGLICISIPNVEGVSLFLWNPSTRNSKKLPDLGLDLDKIYNDDYHVAYGFGYDEVPDDYKVVAIIHDDETPNSGSQVKVCSTRSESWKRIENFPSFVSGTSGIFVRGIGKIYWSGDYHIVSLDLGTETYGSLDEPDCESCFPTSLGILGGKLTLICSNQIGNEVWFMKEYDTKESWTKVLCIPHHVDKLLFKASSISVDDESLGVLSNGFFKLYNAEDHSMKKVEGFDEDNIGFRTATCFIESLVLP